MLKKWLIPILIVLMIIAIVVIIIVSSNTGSKGNLEESEDITVIIPTHHINSEDNYGTDSGTVAGKENQIGSNQTVISSSEVVTETKIVVPTIDTQYPININGTEINFPCTVSEFEKSGFKIPGKVRDNIMDPGHSDTIQMFLNGDLKKELINVVINNYSESPFKYSKCVLSGLMINSKDNKNTNIGIGNIDKLVGANEDKIQKCGVPFNINYKEKSAASYGYKVTTSTSELNYEILTYNKKITEFKVFYYQ